MAAPSETVVVTAVLSWTAEGAAAPFQPVSSTGAGTSPILVLSPDDVLRIRGATAVVPRGNVLFEAALFMGKHGRDRCFLVQPRAHPAFTLPTDLAGIIPATYDETHYRRDPPAALGAACANIRRAIRSSASFNRAVKVVPK